MTFVVGDWVQIVKVVDVEEKDKRDDYERRQIDKRCAIGCCRRIFQIDDARAAFYDGQIYHVTDLRWAFHADELKKIDLPSSPNQGDLIRFSACGAIGKVVSVQPEYRVYYQFDGSSDMKAWSSWESFHGKNYFQVLTQEEKLTHDTAILVAKRNSMVAKAAKSMARSCRKRGNDQGNCRYQRTN